MTQENTVEHLANILDEAIQMQYKDPDNQKYAKILKRVSRFVQRKINGPQVNQSMIEVLKSDDERPGTKQTRTADHRYKTQAKYEQQVRVQAIKEAAAIKRKFINSRNPRNLKTASQQHFKVAPRKPDQYQTTYRQSYNDKNESFYDHLEKKFNDGVNLGELDMMLNDDNASVISEWRQGDFDLIEMEQLLEFIKFKVHENDKDTKSLLRDGRIRTARMSNQSVQDDSRKRIVSMPEKAKLLSKFRKKRPRPLIIASPNHLVTKKGQRQPIHRRATPGPAPLGEPEILKKLQRIDQKEKALKEKREYINSLLKEKVNPAKAFEQAQLKHVPIQNENKSERRFYGTKTRPPSMMDKNRSRRRVIRTKDDVSDLVKSLYN